MELIKNYNSLEKLKEYKVNLEKLRFYEEREKIRKQCKERKEILGNLYEEIINKNRELNIRKSQVKR